MHNDKDVLVLDTEKLMGKNHITIIILYAFLNNVWLNECVSVWVCGCVCHSVNRDKGNY